MGYTFRPEEGPGGMPWKESSVMDERMRFVIRLKDGESMTSLCREFGISRKTGYKILERFEHCGVEGLSDRARRPHRYANQLPAPVEAANRGSQTRKTSLGSAQDLRAAAASLAFAREGASPQHHSCHYGSPRSGGKGQPGQDPGRGNAALCWPEPE